MSGPVRSVSQAFAILRLLAGKGPLTLTQVCRETGLSPSSGLNLLRTLASEGAVERKHGERVYRLAPTWQQADLLVSAQIARIIAAAQPRLTRFAKAHDTACGLWQELGGDRLTLIALGESEAATRIHMVIGQRQPLGAGSIGRACTAADAPDQADLARRFARLRWGRRLDFAAWVEQVARAGQSGFGIDDSFAHPGIVSIGAIVPGTRTPRLFVSASVFAGALTEREIETLGQALCELTRDPIFDAAR